MHVYIYLVTLPNYLIYCIHIVSPVTTHSLLRQLSIRADMHTVTTPPHQTTPSHTPREEIELENIRPKLSTVHSEPGIATMATTAQKRHPLEHSISLPQPDTIKSISQQSTLKRSYISKPTGRLEAEPETIEPKPDLWKIAFLSLRFLSSVSLISIPLHCV